MITALKFVNELQKHNICHSDLWAGNIAIGKPYTKDDFNNEFQMVIIDFDNLR